MVQLLTYPVGIQAKLPSLLSPYSSRSRKRWNYQNNRQGLFYLKQPGTLQKRTKCIQINGLWWFNADPSKQDYFLANALSFFSSLQQAQSYPFSWATCPDENWSRRMYSNRVRTRHTGDAVATFCHSWGAFVNFSQSIIQISLKDFHADLDDCGQPGTFIRRKKSNSLILFCSSRGGGTAGGSNREKKGEWRETGGKKGYLETESMKPGCSGVIHLYFNSPSRGGNFYGPARTLVLQPAWILSRWYQIENCFEPLGKSDILSECFLSFFLSLRFSS